MSIASQVEEELLEKFWEVELESRTEGPYARYYSQPVTLENVKDEYGYLDNSMYELSDKLSSDKEWDIPSGTISIENSVGGYEGGGEEMYKVFRLVDSDGDERFFRVDGYYASWDGDSWEGAELYEVRKVPVQAFNYPRV